jgi:hypothetical protein
LAAAAAAANVAPAAGVAGVGTVAEASAGEVDPAAALGGVGDVVELRPNQGAPHPFAGRLEETKARARTLGAPQILTDGRNSRGEGGFDQLEYMAPMGMRPEEVAARVPHVVFVHPSDHPDVVRSLTQEIAEIIRQPVIVIAQAEPGNFYVATSHGVEKLCPKPKASEVRSAAKMVVVAPKPRLTVTSEAFDTLSKGHLDDAVLIENLRAAAEQVGEAFLLTSGQGRVPPILDTMLFWPKEIDGKPVSQAEAEAMQPLLVRFDPNDPDTTPEKMKAVLNQLALEKQCPVRGVVQAELTPYDHTELMWPKGTSKAALPILRWFVPGTDPEAMKAVLALIATENGCPARGIIQHTLGPVVLVDQLGNQVEYAAPTFDQMIDPRSLLWHEEQVWDEKQAMGQAMDRQIAREALGRKEE